MLVTEGLQTIGITYEVFLNQILADYHPIKVHLQDCIYLTLCKYLQTLQKELHRTIKPYLINFHICISTASFQSIMNCMDATTLF